MTASPSQASRWGIERRVEFIDFRLRWEGTVNRGDLINFFRISPQQASADLARYIEIAPGNIEYDKRFKTYRATAAFTPAVRSHDARSYLGELELLHAGGTPPGASFIGWQPPVDIVRYPARSISTDVFLRVLWAIRDSEELKISYQSMRRTAPTSRWIAPHALASDGQRWHVRAWCSENSEFRDFVIARIQNVQDRRKSEMSPAQDAAWLTYIDIVIAPREGLTDGQRRATEVDFGMVRGRLRLSCRKALAFYLLRRLQLDRPPTEPAVVQPLELVNRDELEDLIAAAQKTSGTTPSQHVEKGNSA